MPEPVIPARSTTQRYEDLPQLLTPEEFGGLIRVSRNTMYELLRRGDVPYVRFGRLIRIPKAALLAAQKNV
jgi:excisionase family DNA binding protein